MAMGLRNGAYVILYRTVVILDRHGGEIGLRALGRGLLCVRWSFVIHYQVHKGKILISITLPL
jgi:hypothetical protein